VVLLVFQTHVKVMSSDTQQAQVVILFWLNVLTKLPGWHKERFAICSCFCNVFSHSNAFQTGFIFLQ